MLFLPYLLVTYNGLFVTGPPFLLHWFVRMDITEILSMSDGHLILLGVHTGRLQAAGCEVNGLASLIFCHITRARIDDSGPIYLRMTLWVLSLRSFLRSGLVHRRRKLDGHQQQIKLHVLLIKMIV